MLYKRKIQTAKVDLGQVSRHNEAKRTRRCIEFGRWIEFGKKFKMRGARKFILALPLFSGVSAELFDSLMREASFLHFTHSAVIIEEGRAVSFLHAVIEGTVELFGAGAIHETTLDIIPPGKVFCLPAVLRNQAYRQSARALTTTKIVTIPAAAIRDLFNRDEGFARAVAVDLAACCDSSIEALKDLKLRRSIERLANWILETHCAQGNNGQIRLKYPKRTLASQLGMTPENLSRNLASLAKHGISLKGRVMTIADADAIRRWGRRDLAAISSVDLEKS
jgi:CRP/FNR family transcriptional regulator, transcriptional activator FtrB